MDISESIHHLPLISFLFEREFSSLQILNNKYCAVI